MFLCMMLFLLLGCSDDGVRLTEDDLKNTFSQTQSALFEGFRYSGRAVLNLDGTATLDVFILGRDQGNWWLDGANICSKWEQAFARKTVCAGIKKYPDGRFSGHHPTTGIKLGTFTLNAETAG